MAKEPLYPHVPKSKQQTETNVERLDTETLLNIIADRFAIHIPDGVEDWRTANNYIKALQKLADRYKLDERRE